MFVDYEQDTFETSGTVRQFDRPVAGLPGGAITYRATCTTHIGGYMGDDADPNPEKRRFNGLIDEVRVSSTALSPEFFLRTLPVGDSTTVA